MSILSMRRSPYRGAYYQSAGAGHDGMDCGASHFLVHDVAASLQSQSVEVLNLGGADQLNPGLQRFKAGFGATTVKLESARFFLGSVLQKKVGTIVHLLQDRAAVLVGHIMKQKFEDVARQSKDVNIM